MLEQCCPDKGGDVAWRLLEYLCNDCCGCAKSWLWANLRSSQPGQCSKVWGSSSTALVDLQV